MGQHKWALSNEHARDEWPEISSSLGYNCNKQKIIIKILGLILGWEFLDRAGNSTWERSEKSKLRWRQFGNDKFYFLYFPMEMTSWFFVLATKFGLILNQKENFGLICQLHFSPPFCLFHSSLSHCPFVYYYTTSV
ncbi:MAG: hypothetical protein Q8807_03465 ['Waltheria sp.' little leaf phytoplasma]|nr:hypothetical protein ['Waltheria sp.' little leaf phytoplasma]